MDDADSRRTPTALPGIARDTDALAFNMTSRAEGRLAAFAAVRLVWASGLLIVVRRAV